MYLWDRQHATTKNSNASGRIRRGRQGALERRKLATQNATSVTGRKASNSSSDHNREPTTKSTKRCLELLKTKKASPNNLTAQEMLSRSRRKVFKQKR
jgi:hypothetical protein